MEANIAKEIRLAKGYEVKELHFLKGYSTSAIYSYESGDREIPDHYAAMLLELEENKKGRS